MNPLKRIVTRANVEEARRMYDGVPGTEKEAAEVAADFRKHVRKAGISNLGVDGHIAGLIIGKVYFARAYPNAVKAGSGHETGLINMFVNPYVASVSPNPYASNGEIERRRKEETKAIKAMIRDHRKNS